MECKSQTFFDDPGTYSIYTSVTTRSPKRHYGLMPKHRKAQAVPSDVCHLNGEAEKLPPFHKPIRRHDLTKVTQQHHDQIRN